MKPLNLDVLRSSVSYDPETGFLTWKRRSGGTGKVGARAGGKNSRGYVIVRVCGQNMPAHRVAWVLTHGEIGNSEIDHINGNRSDNRICNLRAVSKSVNQQNIKSAKAHSSTGFLGVHIHKTGMFEAGIRANGKRYYLGLFKTAEEAHEAYLKAKRTLHEGCTI